MLASLWRIVVGYLVAYSKVSRGGGGCGASQQVVIDPMIPITFVVCFFIGGVVMFCIYERVAPAPPMHRPAPRKVDKKDAAVKKEGEKAENEKEGTPATEKTSQEKKED
eukprot:gnl/TRDRNA2_/TRDRNA2_172055_c1_seq2.p2 gnl/TRDRNA2_/TRDRNA2_172055_c1~~gnl/TRDRNA2_/TRDRNA2_172055_c1_seq2.p2  ORF type:complete len:109 (-),score=29.31 gnl/TRDRNA2_/TRDRNA2_172055_c1_seq2:244-570(-)